MAVKLFVISFISGAAARIYDWGGGGGGGGGGQASGVAYARCRRQCMEARSADRGKKISPSFFSYQDGLSW